MTTTCAIIFHGNLGMTVYCVFIGPGNTLPHWDHTTTSAYNGKVTGLDEVNGKGDQDNHSGEFT
jgi:hypothetical protein